MVAGYITCLFPAPKPSIVHRAIPGSPTPKPPERGGPARWPPTVVIVRPWWQAMAGHTQGAARPPLARGQSIEIWGTHTMPAPVTRATEDMPLQEFGGLALDGQKFEVPRRHSNGGE